VNPLHLLYQRAAALHRGLYRRGTLKRKRLRRPVLSVGNLGFGGTGKTPFTQRVAQELLDCGFKVSILSRGYGRQTHGLVPVSDGTQLLTGVCEAGDEVFLLAKALPRACVTACEDRYAAGLFAEEEHGVDVHLLDDGFQHHRLHRDLDLVLMAGDEDLAARRWREPLETLALADVLVLTGDAWPVEAALRTEFPALPVYKTTLANYGYFTAGERAVDIAWLQKQRWVALAGIARPERFFRELERVPLDLARTLPFPDHFTPTPVDVEQVRKAVLETSARGVLMTQKDFYKWQESRLEIYYHRVGFPPLPGWLLDRIVAACEKPRRS
jgi:tetraacyldisaccharide 4'-kinase